MTYYSSSAYAERYYIDFIDIDGTPWHVSIQQPNFSGTATQLTGAEEPIEWMGVGDEDQTKVVLGSTGTLRIVCLDGQTSIFTQGALIPDIINDRRVVVTRQRTTGGNTYWDTIWQGFIKPEQYTQEWDSTPYETELPIVSAIAATEFFPMPDYADVQEKSYIIDLLWYVLGLTGCSFQRIMTNKPVYEDFYGNVQYDDSVTPAMPWHWSQGTASTMYFYDFDGDGIKPKTIKDVLETICYPYGKIYEYSNGLAIWMSGGKYVYETAKIYGWAYDSLTRRFGEMTRIPELTLSSLQVAGTDNRISFISRPQSVKFNRDDRQESEIFDLTDKYIKQPLQTDNTTPLQDNPLYQRGIFNIAYYNGKTRGIYLIDKQDVNTSAIWNYIGFYPNLSGVTQDYIFLRAVDADVEDSDMNTVTYSLAMPLYLSFANGQAFVFELARPIRTIKNLNMVKLSMKMFGFVYDNNTPTPLHGKENVSTPGYNNATFYILIHDVTAGKCLNLDRNSPNFMQWEQYDPLHSLYSAENMQFINEECVVCFNEPRSDEHEDVSCHKIRLQLSVWDGEQGSPLALPRIVTSLKLEYVRDNTFTIPGMMPVFNDSIKDNGTITNIGGSGEQLNVSFKTLCGQNHIILNGNAYVPYNSFCDSQAYIDTENRKKIEIMDVKFNEDFVAYPFLVNDGSDVYVPVAVGMRPQNNTATLRLVSTNIGLIQS